MTCPPGPPPTITILLPYEGRPKVLVNEGTTEADHDRLLLWLRANPRLHDLVGEAIVMQDDAEELT
jgi:hypothetical protein